MLSIFTKSFIDADEENRTKIYTNSKVGSLVPVSLMGEVNGYYIVKGLVWGTNVLIAPEMNEDETQTEYAVRVRNTTLQGFVDLQAGVIDAIVLSNQQLTLLKMQPEFDITNNG